MQVQVLFEVIFVINIQIIVILYVDEKMILNIFSWIHEVHLIALMQNYLEKKVTKQPFGELQLIHSKICGLLNIRARHGADYFITIMNDFIHFGVVYLISH